MAVDKNIEAAILDEIGNQHVVIIDIVQDELTRRAGIPETAGLAKSLFPASNLIGRSWIPHAT